MTKNSNEKEANQKTNPVQRLKRIFGNIFSCPGNPKMIDVWAKVFDLPNNHPRLILPLLAELYKQVQKAKEDIESLVKLGECTDLYLRPFNKIETTLAMIGLDQNLNSFKATFDEKTLNDLDFSAELLSKFTKERAIQNKDLLDLKTQAEDLLIEVIESELPKNLKEFLVNNLNDFVRAIVFYRINGSFEITKIVNQSIGGIIVLSNEDPTIKPLVKDDPKLKKFYDFITKAQSLTWLGNELGKFAYKAEQLINGIF